MRIIQSTSIYSVGRTYRFEGYTDRQHRDLKCCSSYAFVFMNCSECQMLMNCPMKLASQSVDHVLVLLIG
jgi:hypothetical protein